MQAVHVCALFRGDGSDRRADRQAGRRAGRQAAGRQESRRASRQAGRQVLDRQGLAGGLGGRAGWRIHRRLPDFFHYRYDIIRDSCTGFADVNLAEHACHLVGPVLRDEGQAPLLDISVQCQGRPYLEEAPDAVAGQGVLVQIDQGPGRSAHSLARDGAEVKTNSYRQVRVFLCVWMREPPKATSSQLNPTNRYCACLLSVQFPFLLVI